MNRHAAMLIAALAAGPALGLEVEPLEGWHGQWHGFAAQGAAWSNGNDVLGGSRNGTLALTELGVNGAIDFGDGLLAAAQVVSRRAGDTGDGELRIDYGLLDYQALRGADFSGGLRAGKVKNAYGLFNDTRDVVFTRPGILLPDSVYSDLSGQQRSLLFSTVGGQVYGSAALGRHELSLVATAGRDRGLSREEERSLIDLTVPFSMGLRELRLVRLMDEIDGGRWQLALSHLHARLDLATDVGLSGEFLVESYVASARYHAEGWSVTAEYAPQRTGQSLVIGADRSRDHEWNEGGYLQGDFRVGRGVTAVLRYETMFQFRDDRDGSRRCTGDDGGPAPGHPCYMRDLTAGLRWLPDEHWGLWGEWHAIDGSFNKYSNQDNEDREPARRWNLLLVMGAYRF